MFAAVFGSATSDEMTRPKATPPIAVISMIAEVNPEHAADRQDPIPDKREEHALNDREDAQRQNFAIT